VRRATQNNISDNHQLDRTLDLQYCTVLLIFSHAGRSSSDTVIAQQHRSIIVSGIPMEAATDFDQEFVKLRTVSY
jgi:hypothetical protein